MPSAERPVPVWPALVALLAWQLARLSPLGNELTSYGVVTPGGSLQYLHIDASVLLFALAAAVLLRMPPSPRQGWVLVSVMAFVHGGQLLVGALSRYYGGSARAWDLANYVQPMWRTAHGLAMSSGVYDGKPVWADHGAFAMFGFAPLTAIADDAATGVLCAQSLVTASAVLATYGLARALALPPALAVIASAVLASSRALANASQFDFHAECVFPLALLLSAWAYERKKLGATVAATLLVLSLRDMAALTAMMLWLYYTLRERAQTRLPIVLVGISAAVAALDIVFLPRWTGWASYVALNTSAPIDVPVAIETTLLRSLATFGVGWLHPITWLSGAPWLAAAASSPKLGVKGIDFQYGFLFVPVAMLGVLYALRVLQQRAVRHVALGTALWATLAVSVNAAAPVSLSELGRTRDVFDQVRASLRARVPEGASVAADSCSAPYVMERPELTLFCRIDFERLTATGVERWDFPVTSALEATHLVVRKDCPANDRCVADQIARAQREHGFRLVAGASGGGIPGRGSSGPFVVLSRQP